MRNRRGSLRRFLHEYRGRRAMGCPINKTPETTRSLVHVRPRTEKRKQKSKVKEVEA